MSQGQLQTVILQPSTQQLRLRGGENSTILHPERAGQTLPTGWIGPIVQGAATRGRTHCTDAWNVVPTPLHAYQGV